VDEGGQGLPRFYKKPHCGAGFRRRTKREECSLKNSDRKSVKEFDRKCEFFSQGGPAAIFDGRTRSPVIVEGYNRGTLFVSSAGGDGTQRAFRQGKYGNRYWWREVERSEETGRFRFIESNRAILEIATPIGWSAPSATEVRGQSKRY
jgi:hypothetical protein